MAKLFTLEGPGGSLAYYCQACGTHHAINTVPAPEGTPKEYQWPVWEFDGNFEKPTIKPSVMVKGGADGNVVRCHHYVIEGRINYCSDYESPFAGTTVDIPDLAVEQ